MADRAGRQTTKPFRRPKPRAPLLRYILYIYINLKAQLYTPLLCPTRYHPSNQPPTQPPRRDPSAVIPDAPHKSGHIISTAQMAYTSRFTLIGLLHTFTLVLVPPSPAISRRE